VIEYENPEWHALAACAGKQQIMYAERGVGFHSPYAAARALCESCPVVTACRVEGDLIETHAYRAHGYRAAETPGQRIGRRRSMRNHPTHVAA
jgi:hypothetical protein